MSLESSDIAVIRPEWFIGHDPMAGHPENPGRAQALMSLFTEDRFGELAALAVREATQAELLRVHARSLVEKLNSCHGKQGAFDLDTRYSPQTFKTALLAAGSTLELALRVWKGEFRRGFSLVRPPGHHATRDQAMGFCFLNNIAVAVAGILEEAPQARIAIVDFDLHHGNGTQWAFYDKPEVLFLSSHRYPFFPGTGAFDEMGSGRGKGGTVNLPLSSPHGNAMFFSLYSRLVIPILKSFRPEMIVVSAGFDGHALDPMRGLQLTTEAYAVMAEALISVAEETSGKILFCLEGGYHPKALSDSAAAVLMKMRTCPRSSSFFYPQDLALVEDENRLIQRFCQGLTPYFPELRSLG